MDTKLDVLTLGEVMLRLSPPRHEKLQKGLLLEKSAAGAELNVAAGLAQLGLSAAIATKLPDNDLSRFVLAQARPPASAMMRWSSTAPMRRGWAYTIMKALPPPASPP